MSVARIVAGILIAFGILFFVTAILTPDEGSCPLITPGQPMPFCEHYYPGTTIYVPTIWRALTILSVLALGSGTAMFLISERREHRNTGRTPISHMVAGTVMVSATSAIIVGGLAVPIILGSPFFSLNGMLNGFEVGLTIGIGIHLLSRQNPGSAKPKLP